MNLLVYFTHPCNCSKLLLFVTKFISFYHACCLRNHKAFSHAIYRPTAKRCGVCLPQASAYQVQCSNPRCSWVTYFSLSNICNFSQLVLSILSTHPLFALSIFVTLSIFRRRIKRLSSSRPLLSIHFLRYHLTL